MYFFLTRRFLFRMGLAGILGALLAAGLSACADPIRTPVPGATLPASTATATPTPIRPAPSPSPFPSPTATRKAPALLRYGDVSPAFSPAPWRETDDAPIQPIWGLVWESLVIPDPATGALLPGLAARWDISSEGTVLRFELCESVKWHDGTPLTAEDVAATLRYFSAPDTRSLWRIHLQGVEGVEAAGPTTVVVRLKEADCAALSRIGQVPIVPAKAVAAHAGGTDGAHPPAGTGPYRIESIESDGALSLAANAGYREEVMAAHILYRPFAGEASLRAAWDAGELDLAHFPAGTGAAAAAPMPAATYSFPGAEYFLVILNTERRPLNDADVRRALGFALDRASLAEQVSPAGATLLGTTLLPEHWALSGGEVSPPAYSPQRASDLLNAAGWMDEDGDGVRSKDGQVLHLDVVTNGDNPMRMATASLAAQFYRTVGVESEVHFVEWGIFLDMLFRRDFDIAVLSWPFPLDPDQRHFWLSTETREGSGFNLAGWENPRVDGILQQAASVRRCAVSERAKLYGEWAQAMAEERPVDPLFVPHDVLLVREDIAGLAPSPFAGALWNIHRWYLR